MLPGDRATRIPTNSATAPPEMYERHLVGPLFQRSEEHTSELQSRPHLVCRLLLEKKKKTTDRSEPFSCSFPSQYRSRPRPFSERSSLCCWVTRRSAPRACRSSASSTS